LRVFSDMDAAAKVSASRCSASVFFCRAFIVWCCGLTCGDRIGTTSDKGNRKMVDRYLKGRRGQFDIPMDTIHFNPELARAIQAEVLIVRAEIRYDRDALEIIGLGEYFDRVPPGSPTPEFTVQVKEVRNDEGDLTGHEIDFVPAKR